MPRMSIAVHHRPEAGCFEAVVDGLRSECAYRLAPGVVTLFHTEVPQALQGRGVAAALVAAALAWARAEGLKVRPSCSYVAIHMRRHPETQDLLENP